MKTDKTLMKAAYQDITDAQAASSANAQAEYIGRLLKRYQKSTDQRLTDVLNVGCGLGRHDSRLRKMGFDVWGIDIVPGFIKIARKRHPGFAKRYKVGSMTRLPYKDGSFDALLCLFSTFNIPRDGENKKALREFFRVLKAGGLLLMDMQNKGPTKAGCGTWTSEASNGMFKVSRTRVVGNYLIGDETLFIRDEKGREKKIGHNVDKERLYTPRELEQLCKRNGFDVLRFYRAYSLHALGPKDPQYLVVARKRAS